MSAEIMNKILRFEEPHKILRNTETLEIDVRTVLYRTESISALAPKIWSLTYMVNKKLPQLPLQNIHY